MENTLIVPVSQQDNSSTVNNIVAENFSPLLLQLEQQQYAIADEFLPAGDYQALLHLAKQWHQDGKFRSARIGQATQAQQAQDIRRDKICWLDDLSTHPALNNYFNTMNQLIKQLNRTFYLGLTQFEVHLAIYQPGDFYRRHIDQFQANSERIISCVYYLNPQWEEHHEGELQLYDEKNHELLKITPISNRFVCFLSHLPHEVYPTHNTRYSITGWLKNSRDASKFTWK